MPIFNAPLTALDQKECKRYAGLSVKADFPEELIAKACLEAQILIMPRGIWEIYPYDNQQNTILAEKPVKLTAEGIIKHLQAANKVAVMAVTIGYDLETEVTKHFTAGNYTNGLLLDAAGTTAVEANADYISNLIAQAAGREGLSPLFRFSPGYGNWDITSQPDMLALSGGRRIEIDVTPACILTPRKSVTAVIGLVPNAKGTPVNPTACKLHACQTCQQANCLARKEPVK